MHGAICNETCHKQTAPFNLKFPDGKDICFDVEAEISLYGFNTDRLIFKIKFLCNGIFCIMTNFENFPRKQIKNAQNGQGMRKQKKKFLAGRRSVETYWISR